MICLKKLISIVVPVYNEGKNVVFFYNELTAVVNHLHKYNFEIIFTDNHSSDNTFSLIKALAVQDPRIKALRFSRNFGYQNSIYTGFISAQGEAAIQMDCDLQDPPQYIETFIDKWTQGYKVIYGIRERRKEGMLITFSRKCFYRIINLLSEYPIPVDAGDFRLLDRRVINELKKMDDMQLYLRGAIAEIGFDQIGIPYQRQERKYGESKFKLRDLFALAWNGIANHSIIPLRISSYIGLAISLITCIGIAGYFLGNFFLGKHWPAGFATTTALILLSISLNALFLGIIGEYLGRIYKQTKKRPHVIVEETCAFSSKDVEVV